MDAEGMTPPTVISRTDFIFGAVIISRDATWVCNARDLHFTKTSLWVKALALRATIYW